MLTAVRADERRINDMYLDVLLLYSRSVINRENIIFIRTFSLKL